MDNGAGHPARSLRIMLPVEVAALGVNRRVGETAIVPIELTGSGVSSCRVSAKSSSNAILLKMAATDLDLDADGKAATSLAVQVLAPSEKVWIQVDAVGDGEIPQTSGFFMRGDV